MNNYFSNKIDEQDSTDKIFTNHSYNKNLFLDSFSSNKNTLLILCILSAVVYKYREDYIHYLFKIWKMKYSLTLIESLVYGIFYNKDNIVISFKGTSSFSDILTDLKFIEKNDMYHIPGKMHKGFHDLILKDKICEIIKERLNKRITTQKILYITGHSMGGAVATLFYSYLKGQLFDLPIKLVTFGSPKVGDHKFSNNLIDTTRIVNGCDLITFLPFNICGKYSHCKKTKKYKLKSKYSLPNTKDHHILSYYKSLIKLN